MIVPIKWRDRAPSGRLMQLLSEWQPVPSSEPVLSRGSQIRSHPVRDLVVFRENLISAQSLAPLLDPRFGWLRQRLRSPQLNASLKKAEESRIVGMLLWGEWQLEQY